MLSKGFRRSLEEQSAEIKRIAAFAPYWLPEARKKWRKLTPKQRTEFANDLLVVTSPRLVTQFLCLVDHDHA